MRIPIALHRVARCLAAIAIACATFGAAALDLQGHRGARGLAPENTLRAFEVALQHGVTTLELDIAITRDGALVIHHDLALNPAIARDAQGRWLEQPSAPIQGVDGLITDRPYIARKVLAARGIVPR